MRRPLEGIRVLDLTIWQQGTYASAMLADLGADVVKVEEPGSGDPGRYFAVAEAVGLSSYFEAHNRGKRSIALNLKDPAARDVFLRLAASADVFLTNFRTSAIERMGLTYDALRTANGRIVYVQASGHGQYGDEADMGSFDLLAQARGGLMSVTGEPDGPPEPAGVPVGDQVGALHAAIAVLAGIVARDATGSSLRMDTSLLGSQLSLQSFNITNYLFSGDVPKRRSRGGPTPFWRTYQASDGNWFVIGMLLDRAWPDVAHVIGRPELADDARFATFRDRAAVHAADLIAVLEEAFVAAPARHWVDRLNAVGMFAAPVQDYAQVAVDPQVLANGYIHEVPRPDGEPVRVVGIGMCVDGEPVTVQRLASQLGADTEAVLLEAGYSWDEITSLRERGIIGAPKRTAQ
jgi:crotonobetainyl-CoA:carnitine CoA-transferase CaiB-like acyl-CoA transferase